MNRPLVSVIVPIYNTEKYLKKCLDSILKQSYDNIEIILIDDGSSDNSFQICESYKVKDSRIITIHKVNEGQGVARNVGLKIAQGEYICFIDSDDYVLPTYIESLLNNCLNNDVPMCVCGFIVNSGIRNARYIPKQQLLGHEELMKCYLTTSDIGGGPCNKIFRRSLFNNHLFPKLRANEDAYLMPELFLECQSAIVIDEALYIQVVRDNSTERGKFSQRNFSLLEVEDHLRDIIIRNYPEFEKYILLRKARTILGLMSKAIRSDFWDKDKYFEKLTNYLNIEIDAITASNRITGNREYNYLKFKANHPNLLKIEMQIKTFVRMCRKTLKKMVFCLKR